MSRARSAPHGLTAADLVSLARVSEPALSPDGRRVVYTLRETDLAGDRGRTDLWLLGPRRRLAPRRLTSHEENDGAADWAGSDRGVYFLSSRSGSPQVWYLTLAGGEATQVTRLPLEVASFRASPRGDRLVVAVEVFPDCATSSARKNASKKTQAAKQHGQALRSAVRAPLGPVEGRAGVEALLDRARWRIARARASRFRSRPALDADIPSKPLGGRDDYAFSPDGKQLVIAARLRGRDEPWSTNFDVWRVPVGRQRRARQPDGGQPGLGRAARVLAGRPPARAPGDGAAGLRGRPVPPRRA